MQRDGVSSRGQLVMGPKTLMVLLTVLLLFAIAGWEVMQSV